MSNLKPCPFCGGEAELCYGPGLGTDSCRGYTLLASCNECGAKSPSLWQEKKPESDDQSWKDAADEWNCRPGEIDATKCGVGYCEHHREGLPVCVECREESTIAHDKACALLAEARAEIERLALELENKQYTITCASEENQQLKESLAEARAGIENLKWHINSEKAKAEAALTLNDRALGLVNEARTNAEHWKSECDALQRMVHEARAEIAWMKTDNIARGTANINMIGLLVDAISDVIRHAEPPQHNMQGCVRANCWWCQAIRVRNAALLAVERGE